MAFQRVNKVNTITQHPIIQVPARGYSNSLDQQIVLDSGSTSDNINHDFWMLFILYINMYNYTIHNILYKFFFVSTNM